MTVILGLLLASATAPAAQPTIESARVVRHVENPDGLQVGFWANYRMSGAVLADFGPRPFERVNFHKWAQFERQPGRYEFENRFKWEQWAHLAGSSVITNVNTFFTLRLNPEGMQAIPGHLPQDITDPHTRAAAGRFLRAFTQQLLKEVGTAHLALDYEMIWFAKPTRPEIRQAYRDWFVESAEICRAAAREMGMSDRLTIGVIVNTDPFDTAGHSIGSPARPKHVPQQWLLDCVGVADWVGIDTYAGGHARRVTPDDQLRVIQFWIDHYVGGKPVWITEAGFTTSRAAGDASDGYHIRGTEGEQAAYFEALLGALRHAKRDRSNPLHAVRGIGIWKYADRADEQSLVERHFGLVRSDGTRKPAHAVVFRPLREIDRDPRLAPTRTTETRDVLAQLRGRQPVSIGRAGGTTFDELELRITPASPSISLEIDTADAVCVMVGAGDRWFSTHPATSRRSKIEISGLTPSAPAVLRVRVAAERLPMETRIVGVRVEKGENQ
ncbi:MAG TPA: hypothetical protein PKB10_10885, partial [Tepidisphaeraceae bacterium]|nr:hypothetical protein [Tepidisphaeraceae bacterium]